jgi:hypothetical protein
MTTISLKVKGAWQNGKQLMTVGREAKTTIEIYEKPW